MTKAEDKHRVSYLESHAKWKTPPTGNAKAAASYAGTTDRRVTQRFPEYDELPADPKAVGAGAFYDVYCCGSKEMMRVIFVAYPESEFCQEGRPCIFLFFARASNLEKRSWIGCLKEDQDDDEESPV